MPKDDTHEFVWRDGMHAIAEGAWQGLVGEHPFLKHAFLLALEQTSAVGGESGWQSCPLLCYQGQQLVAAMPLYLKMHSYGEYVFDWAWADAYQRAGGQYYPKLIAAIPFSPITGARILTQAGLADTGAVAEGLLNAIAERCQAQALSGAHVLFPDALSAEFCANSGWLRRDGVQFRWENRDYSDWPSFLATLSHDKRKKIKQEQKKVSQQGVRCRTVLGSDATPSDWALFYQCYCNTYYLHGSRPYLPASFFNQLAATMPQNLVLFIANQDGKDIACSLCVHNAQTLYGRYWGALANVSCLHFELCYYQPQQFCIDMNLRYFEGGAQGEHKLARGFDPYPTCSYHWLRDPALHQAVADFLQREKSMVAAYVDELEERSPFKHD